MKKPRAGDFFYSVAFDSLTSSSDGAGGTTGTWSEQFTRRAAFTHLRGGETVLAARLEGRHIQVITVRKSAAVDAVTTDWRIRDERTSEAFNIREVVQDLDRRTVSFLCEKGVATN